MPTRFIHRVHGHCRPQASRGLKKGMSLALDRVARGDNIWAKEMAGSFSSFGEISRPPVTWFLHAHGGSTHMERAKQRESWGAKGVP